MAKRRAYKRDRMGRFATVASSQGKSSPRKAALVGAHAYAGVHAAGSGHRVTAALHGAKIATVAGQSAARRVHRSYKGKHSEKIRSAESGLAKAEGYVDKALATSYLAITGNKVATKGIRRAAQYGQARDAARLGMFV